jgi:tetratricopeptide (TPR) repeat protein
MIRSPAECAKAAAAAYAAGDDTLALREAFDGLSLDSCHRECRIIAAFSHQRQGQFRQAIALYRLLIGDRQDNAYVLCNLAQLQQILRLHEQALGTLELALHQSNGADSRIQIQRGMLLISLNRNIEATVALRKAVEADPAHAEAHNRLGLLLHDQGLIQESFASFGQAIQCGRSYAAPAYNLGNLLLDSGLLSHARHFLKLALEFNPSHIPAAWSLGLASLTAGDYDEGWRLYEQRFHLSPNPIRPTAQPVGPRWRDSMSFPSDLLVVSEQGLGDSLQFVRYVPVLAERCPSTRLIVAVQRPLVEICRDALPGFIVVDITTDLPHDIHLPWIPLLSLPLLLGLCTPADLEVPMPYLSVADSLLEFWGKLVSQASGFKLALHWQGNPRAERRNLAGRSLPLEALAPLMSLPGLTLVSIQKGEAAGQRFGCSFANHFISCQDEIDATWDFRDIAAILRCCDMLITTDTSAAHLAGGLGVPTWLLLHRPSDWRWGEHPECTHWYPSMRLWRQPAPGRWDAVVTSLIEPLRQRLDQNVSLKIES